MEVDGSELTRFHEELLTASLFSTFLPQAIFGLDIFLYNATLYELFIHGVGLPQTR